MPLYMCEAASSEVEAVLRAAPSGSLVVSRWARVEFASTLARNVRMELQKEARAC